MMIEIPNLCSSMKTHGELWAFWNQYHRAGPKLSGSLFPSRYPNYVNATRRLAAWAANRATALQCYERGDRKGAERYNRICRVVFSSLPLWAR